ncbi:MAG: hypothetical protein VST68_11815 [Nitrospirota bacterium]|nr:hypothetical protein [Nitrospirota bacterium]
MLKGPPAAFSLTYFQYPPRAKMPAAFPVEKGVLAQLGFGGEKAGLFEHPVLLLMFSKSMAMESLACGAIEIR